MAETTTKLELLKVKLSPTLKEEFKTLSHLKGQSMSEIVRQLITDLCQENNSEILEIRERIAKLKTEKK